jgi:hypothetical protein
MTRANDQDFLSPHNLFLDRKMLMSIDDGSSLTMQDAYLNGLGIVSNKLSLHLFVADVQAV